MLQPLACTFGGPNRARHVFDACSQFTLDFGALTAMAAFQIYDILDVLCHSSKVDNNERRSSMMEIVRHLVFLQSLVTRSRGGDHTTVELVEESRFFVLEVE
jgi:hypothetical protein